MRILLCGGTSDALQRELRALGHEVEAPSGTDWWKIMIEGGRPFVWRELASIQINKFKPEVIILNKGLHWFNGYLWHVPVDILWEARRKGTIIAFICADDPAITPIILDNMVAGPAHYWLTSCPGINSMFHSLIVRTSAQIVEWWLAWDEQIGEIAENPNLKVDVAICGTPYTQPFPPPHYRKGFGFPRRDLALKIVDAGLNLGLWGPEDWCYRARGGDERLRPYWHGHVMWRDILPVYRSARVVWGSQLVEGYRYESGKCVWVGGAGGFLLHEARPGLYEEFGGSILWHKVGDLDHAMSQIMFALSDGFANTREQMRKDLHSIVLARHTWKHRTEVLHNLLLSHKKVQ